MNFETVPKPESFDENWAHDARFWLEDSGVEWHTVFYTDDTSFDGRNVTIEEW